MIRAPERHARPKELSAGLYRGLVVALLLVLLAQLLFSAIKKSPTIDESNHLTRGYAYLKTGDLRLSRDEGHPPLFNLICALPLLVLRDLALPTHRASWQVGFRNAFAVEFLFGEGLPVEHVFFLGRLPVMLTTLLLAALVARWAGELYGRWGALLALVFCAFDPNLLAHGRLITTDVGATFAYLLATYVFWRFLRRPSVVWLVLSGLGLGIAQGIKFSSLLLVPMLGLLGAIECFRASSRLRWPRRPKVWGQGWLSGVLALSAAMGVMAAVAGMMAWAIYGFRVGRATMPSGISWLPESLPFPVPAPIYVEGLLKTVAHASDVGHPTFLMGERSTSGWWTYFPVAFAVKTPVPTLVALLGSLLSLVWRRLRRGEWALLLVPGIYFGLSLSSVLNIGYRHLLPMLPFLWVYVGRLGPIAAEMRIGMGSAGVPPSAIWKARLRTGGVVVLLGWLVAGSLSIAPDYLAFFNLIAGGPREGWRILVDSNLDWGQELWALDAFLKERAPERVHLSWFGCTYPHLYGRDLEYRLLPSHFAYPYPSTAARSAYNPLHPEPGLYVIGATNLNGVGLAAGDVFARFRDLEPVERIGHSLFVYDVPGETGTRGDPPTCISGLRFKDLTAETNAASIGRGLGAVKWFDHGASFVLPGTGAPAYVLPSPPLAFATAWQTAFLDSAEVVHRQVEDLRATSGRRLPGATVYHLDRAAADALGSLILAETEGAPRRWSPAVVFDGDAEYHSLEGPAAFDYGLDLVGYVILTGTPMRRGETLELITVWRPRGELGAAASELKVFVHLMDAQSRVWGAEDRLDLHPPTWERDDLLVQMHRVPLSADAPAGLFQLEIGLYAPITMKRLALYDGPDREQPVGDRLLLTPITVLE